MGAGHGGCNVANGLWVLLAIWAPAPRNLFRTRIKPLGHLNSEEGPKAGCFIPESFSIEKGAWAVEVHLGILELVGKHWEISGRTIGNPPAALRRLKEKKVLVELASGGKVRHFLIWPDGLDSFYKP